MVLLKTTLSSPPKKELDNWLSRTAFFEGLRAHGACCATNPIEAEWWDVNIKLEKIKYRLSSFTPNFMSLILKGKTKLGTAAFWRRIIAAVPKFSVRGENRKIILRNKLLVLTKKSTK